MELELVAHRLPAAQHLLVLGAIAAAERPREHLVRPPAEQRALLAAAAAFDQRLVDEGVLGARVLDEEYEVGQAVEQRLELGVGHCAEILVGAESPDKTRALRGRTVAAGRSYADPPDRGGRFRALGRAVPGANLAEPAGALSGALPAGRIDRRR